MIFDYKKYFKGKKITMLGLGLLGRGLGDAKFFAECGADLIITDLKSKEQLANSLKKLSKYKNIKYVLGKHDLDDFRNRDFVLKSAGVPLDSPYIAEARRNKISIEMDASLFVKLVGKKVKIIGVTGTRGKTTTTYLIYEILKKAFGEKKVHLAGNIKGIATLPLIKKVREGDFVILELDSWQLQGFGEAKISPQISVFTNFMDDHLNYYKGDREKYFGDKANIFLNQEKDGYLILGENTQNSFLTIYRKKMKSKVLTVNVKNIENWKVKLKGKHNLENIACAVAVARVLKITDEKIKKVVENFEGVSGRMEFVKEINGVKIYNDTTATTPDATISALRALSPVQSKISQDKIKKIILILGGADKNLDMSALIKEIPKHCKAVILLPGTGTNKIQDSKFKIQNAKNLENAVEIAMKSAKKGDILLFSPAFASFGLFKNEYDRGDKFMKIINKLR